MTSDKGLEEIYLCSKKAEELTKINCPKKQKYLRALFYKGNSRKAVRDGWSELEKAGQS